MFQKSIYGVITCLLCFNQAWATENKDISSLIQKDIVQLQAPLYGQIKKSNIAKVQEEYNKLFDDDQRIKLYLQVPYEKRQYIFPMIQTAPFVSHKIKTHPEIIIWKNKKPTVIAPQLKEFAQNHLNNLSPFFYIYLDPDFWTKSTEKKIAPTFNNPYAMLTEKEADYVYPTLQQLFEISDQSADEYLKTSLTNEDILKVSNVIALLDTYQPTNGSLKELSLKLINVQHKQIHRATADPFKMLVRSLKELGEETKFSSFLKDQGFSSSNEFAEKADLLLKSFQILNLNLNAAIEINHIRYTRQTKPFNEDEFGQQDIDPIDMYIRLHQASSGDVYFVKENLSKLKNVFKTDFINKGIMILVD